MPTAPPTPRHKNKKKFKAELFDNLCRMKFGRLANKAELQQCIEFITTRSQNLPELPKAKASKKVLYDWIVNNLPSYYLLLLDN
jgi:hypothetical protein